MEQEVLAFVISAALGFLTALVLRGVFRAVLAGLLLLAALALAGTLGIPVFDPTFLWQKFAEAAKLLPSAREVIALVLEQKLAPLAVIGYLTGLLVGLLRHVG